MTSSNDISSKFIITIETEIIEEKGVHQMISDYLDSMFYAYMHVYEHVTLYFLCSTNPFLEQIPLLEPCQ